MLFNKMNNLKYCNLWNLVIVATRLYSTIYVVVFLWSDRTVEKKMWLLNKEYCIWENENKTVYPHLREWKAIEKVDI